MSVFVGFVTDEGALQLDHRAAFLAYARRFKGEEVEVEIRRRRIKRTDRQSRGFHAMVSAWSRDEGYAIEDLKRDLLREVFGTHEATSPVTGEVVQVLNEPHTSALTVAQFSELIERTLEIAARCGYVLEAPNEYTARQKAEQRTRAKRGTAA